jgi:hypothetical protein
MAALLFDDDLYFLRCLRKFSAAELVAELRVEAVAIAKWGLRSNVDRRPIVGGDNNAQIFLQATVVGWLG